MVKSYSMRNTFVFTKIVEDKTNRNESAKVSQCTLNIAKETVESIRFERVLGTISHVLAIPEGSDD